MKKIFSAIAALAIVAMPALAQQYPSPTFNNVTIQGTGTAVTRSQGDNSTKLATTSYVDSGLATKPTLIGGVIPISQGGTNAGTASGARGQLGAASSGANGDITSISGLTTALSVGQGGTGSPTAAGARTNLGLGSAAVQNIGTSGANVPLLNGTNTWIGVQIVPGINVYGAASSGSQTQYFSAGGNSRWAFGIDNSTESGGNTGGNWFVNSYSDAGSYLTTPISIQRSNGIVTINNGLAVGNAGITVNAGALTVNNGINLNYNGVSGQLRANNIQTAGVIRWQYGGSGTSETGGNTGTDFFINSFNDAGTYIGTPFQITRSSGNTQLTSLSVLNGANLNTLSLTTALPVTSGGTGSGTAATAFANLGGTAVGKAASTMSGTWTPSLTFGGGSTGLTTSVLSGTYTRIGNLVFYQARITLTAVGSSTGTAVISGLPFTNGPAYSISNVYAANFVGGSAPLQGLISGSSSAINVYTANGASGTGSVALTNANFTNTSSMVVQGILDLNTLN